MAEKTYDSPVKERFEFVLSINGNIICQRYFGINNFQERSLGSVNLSEAVRACMALIDRDLKEKTDIYNYYTAPQVFKDKEEMEYLFVVSDGESYGICSPLGKLILPYEYSMIDMDDDLCIVLERKTDGEYEVGYYDSGKDIICHEAAEMKDGVVLLDDEGDYIWFGHFRYKKDDDYSGWTDQELRDAADIAYEGYSRLELGLED